MKRSWRKTPHIAVFAKGLRVAIGSGNSPDGEPTGYRKNRAALAKEPRNRGSNGCKVVITNTPRGARMTIVKKTLPEFEASANRPQRYALLRQETL